MDRYEPLKIEEKWQARWEKEKPFKATETSDQPKVFLAEMFPYPSGAGLHVGHVRNFTIVDVLTRFFKQQQMNVMRPFGYDTFGLPAENYAIKSVSKLKGSAMLSTGIAKSILPTQNTTSGLSGASFNFTKKVSPTKRNPTNGGAQSTKLCSRTNKSKTANAGAVATK